MKTRVVAHAFGLCLTNTAADQKGALMKNTVKITTTSTEIEVISPYNKLFVSDARTVGGKFNSGSKAWFFDIRDESRVRDLCLEYFCTNGLISELVTLRVLFKSGRNREQDSIIFRILPQSSRPPAAKHAHQPARDGARVQPSGSVTEAARNGVPLQNLAKTADVHG